MASNEQAGLEHRACRLSLFHQLVWYFSRIYYAHVLYDDVKSDISDGGNQFV